MKNKWLKNIHGFSMVEMMAAMLIAGSILGVVGSFLVVHMRSYSITQSVVDVQYDAQMGLNQMSEIAMESKGIHLMKDELGVDLNLQTGLVEPWLIVFKGEIGSGTVSDPYKDYFYVFLRQKDNTTTGVVSDNKIYYAEANGATELATLMTSLTPLNSRGNALFTEFARNVTHLSLIPGKASSSSAESFDDSKSVEIRLSFVNGEVQLESKTQVTFRNKPSKP